MATYYSLLSPSIFWKFDDLEKCDRLWSPTFSFFELRWKLTFTRFMDSTDTEKIQIDLKCLNIENIETKRKINIEVKIPEHSKKYGSQSHLLTLNCSKWCVWIDTMENIKYYVKRTNDICFFIKLTHVDEMDEQLFIEEQAKQKAKKETPYITRLAEDIGKLYNNKEHSDFELKCGQLSLPVHKGILSTRCGYFATVFSSPMKEADQKFIELKDINPKILKHVIHFLYTGNLTNLPLDDIRKVYDTADMFSFESLQIKCHYLMLDHYLKEPQNNEEENVTKIQETDNDTKILETYVNPRLYGKSKARCGNQDNRKRELLKRLFLSTEWEILSEEFPELVNEMCKPIFLGPV